MNFSEQFFCATIIVFGLDAYHWKPGLLGKTKSLILKYDVMVVPIVAEHFWSNPARFL